MRWFRGRGRRGVGGAVGGQQRVLLAFAGEQEEDDRRTQQDCDDPRGVGPLVAVEECLLRAGGDLLCVLRVLSRGRLSAREGLGQLGLYVVGDLVLVGRGRDGGGDGRGVAGGEQGPKDRLHDGAA